MMVSNNASISFSFQQSWVTQWGTKRKRKEKKGTSFFFIFGDYFGDNWFRVFHFL